MVGFLKVKNKLPNY